MKTQSGRHACPDFADRFAGRGSEGGLRAASEVGKVLPGLVVMDTLDLRVSDDPAPALDLARGMEGHDYDEAAFAAEPGFGASMARQRNSRLPAGICLIPPGVQISPGWIGDPRSTVGAPGGERRPVRLDRVAARAGDAPWRRTSPAPSLPTRPMTGTASGP